MVCREPGKSLLRLEVEPGEVEDVERPVVVDRVARAQFGALVKSVTDAAGNFHFRRALIPSEAGLREQTRRVVRKESLLDAGQSVAGPRVWPDVLGAPAKREPRRKTKAALRADRRIPIGV
jgi:hypothetical protein